MNKFDGTNFDFYLLLPIKMADKMTKIWMDMYRKLEKSRVFNIIGLQIPDNYIYILTQKLRTTKF
jgi:hypothetical protein